MLSLDNTIQAIFVQPRGIFYIYPPWTKRFASSGPGYWLLDITEVVVSGTAHVSVSLAKLCCGNERLKFHFLHWSGETVLHTIFTVGPRW